MRVLLAGIVIAMVGLPLLAAQEKKMEMPVAKEDARLNMIKKLAGDWLQLDDEGNPGDTVALQYKVTVAGSAVAETIAVDTPMEMITMYHLDGDKHMHGLVVTFVDDDTLNHDWTLFGDGKEQQTISMRFVRKN